jgi:hypothetical protein
VQIAKAIANIYLKVTHLYSPNFKKYLKLYKYNGITYLRLLNVTKNRTFDIVISASTFIKLDFLFSSLFTTSYPGPLRGSEALVREHSRPQKQVGNLSEHARRKSIWRHILGVFREFIWF